MARTSLCRLERTARHPGSERRPFRDILAETVAARPKQIALAFPLGVPYMERITRGVMEHARRRGGWQLVFNPEVVETPLEALRGSGVDGVMAFVSAKREARRLLALGVPAVNLASALADPLVPNVTVENRAVGRLAAAHLLERGFRHFAYYGVSDVSYGRERGAGFVAAVREAGFACAVCYAKSGLDRGRPSLVDRRQLRAWLRKLPRPVGLLAVHDYRARVVLEVCQALGLRVPDDVAIVGVDDDVVLCELSTPSLSSVALPGFEIGQRAAEVLDGLMRGGPPPAGPVYVAPTQVVARRSTDVLAFEDGTVAEAVRLIHERIAEALNVAQLADEVSVSRRLLERRFKAALGVTPHDYLSRARVERAKRLLRASPAPTLKEVAAQCGFTDARRMNIVFRRFEGTSPQDYRRGAAGRPVRAAQI